VSAPLRGGGLDNPGDWQSIEVEPGIGLSVPPDAREAGGLPIDSMAGVFDGDGYRITYDLGRFGERLDSLAREHSTQLRSREVAGRTATEVAFAPSDEPFGWTRIVQVGAGSGRTLTMRVSCESIERCSLADRVFDSITIV
jgi:hypothetical protein